jgi:putative endonuclease
MNPVTASFFYEYVLRSKTSLNFYTGYAQDLRKRLSQHLDGQSSYTSSRGPYELIYFEGCANEQDARAREGYLKTGMGKRYLKNRLKRFLAVTG